MRKKISKFQARELDTALKSIDSYQINVALDKGWEVDLDAAEKVFWDHLTELSKDELIEMLKNDLCIMPSDPKISITNLVGALETEIEQQADEFLGKLRGLEQ